MDNQPPATPPESHRQNKAHATDENIEVEILTLADVRSTECEMVQMTEQEEDLINRMFNLVGDRWDLIAGRIPNRKPEEIERFVLMRERQGLISRRK